MNLSTNQDRSAAPTAARTHKVLLVEDNPGDAFLVRTLLGGTKFSSFEVSNVKCLQEAFDTIVTHPDIEVILLDLNLLDSSGEETFLALRERFPSIPTVVFTGMSEARLALELLNKGAYAFLRKDEMTESVLFNTVYGCLQRRDKERELLHHKEIAELADHQKTDFLGRVSHELRTPLTSILGFTQLLRNSLRFSATDFAHLSKIEKNARHLKILIGDLLDVSKIESGHVDVSIVEVNLPALLDDIFTTLKVHADQKKVPLCCRSEDKIPKVIYTDKTRIKQILFNIIGNAIKYTSAEGVEVLLSTDEKVLKFDIRDHGSGIPENRRKELFKPYARIYSSTEKTQGTGLGLVVARGLARALGGDVVLNQSGPEGSTFSATIAAAPDTKEPAIEYAWPSETPHSVMGGEDYTPAYLGHLKLLIVEDVEDIRILYQEVLKRFGSPQICFAGTGKEGFEKALSQNPDAVLLDLSLPDEDGTEVAKRLRASGFKKPILALTAHALPEYRHRTKECGFDSYLAKPVNFPKLAHRLISLTRESKPTDETHH